MKKKKKQTLQSQRDFYAALFGEEVCDGEQFATIEELDDAINVAFAAPMGAIGSQKVTDMCISTILNALHSVMVRWKRQYSKHYFGS